MPLSLPDDLRTEIESYFIRRETTKWIRQATGVCVAQVNKMRKNWELYSLTIAPKHEQQGRPRHITAAMEEDLLGYLEQRPTAYLDEMAWFIFDEYDVEVTPRTISNCLHRMGWTRKKVLYPWFLRHIKH